MKKQPLKKKIDSINTFPLKLIDSTSVLLRQHRRCSIMPMFTHNLIRQLQESAKEI